MAVDLLSTIACNDMARYTATSTMGKMLQMSDKTNTEKAYRLLREDIVSGRLAPDLKLKIEMLRQRYSLGASPIREALARLSGEHLVTLEGQRGCQVAPMSINDAHDIGRMRKMIEAEALRLAIPAGNQSWEDTVITSFHRLERVERRSDQGIDDLAEWEILNGRFHQALVSACGSPWLLRIRSLLFDQHERYRRLSRMRTVLTRDINEEHRRLMEAALDRDAEEAVKIIEVHVERTTDAVVDALQQQSDKAVSLVAS